ncbi:thiamine-phosphate pyrophosphorylase [Parapedobacter luteus]|uniref:Thiamine-phosphate synthase n=1 Tax=Parapedobacter luteus TaxID=623280 RepID=A0A1T5AP64_9SPHI|nr:thiamine phosphate synthase [Parapedobacter luteus]SKB36403.1 thiamine-phosphate pyrophosphorylase [Parapedobacter luteus]
MKLDRPFPYRLYLVMSEADCHGRDPLWVAEEAILGGVDIIQLREKGAAVEVFLKKAAQLKTVTDRYDVPLIINDDLKVAIRVGAFGMHVGQQDLPPSGVREAWSDCRLLGYSIERLEQLQSAEAALADYLGVSPIFRTATKTDTVSEWGIAGIRQLRGLTDKPLVAIGRMNRGNVAAVIQAGADCVAVVSAICAADDPRAAAADLKALINNAIAI